MLLHKATKVEIADASVGTTAAEVFADGDGTTQFTVVNDHGSNTLYVGWDSTVSSTPATHFIGGDLATTESIVISGYVGAIWLEGSGASTTYRVERRYVPRSG